MGVWEDNQGKNYSICTIPPLPHSKGLIFGEVLANEFHISLLLYAMALCAFKIVQSLEDASS
ncbi:hypothetical protein KY285_004695 [Solanum tuberosum]|nr:hypothetical protein KY285_004695 [Solanum tuberosum]